jgi:hypothetical protein
MPGIQPGILSHDSSLLFTAYACFLFQQMEYILLCCTACTFACSQFEFTIYNSTVTIQQ